MNLGNANLKTVNSSRPQLLHSLSEQSIAASDDYYSFSEHASVDSNTHSQITVIRYETPPSQTRSLNSSPDNSPLQATLLSKPDKLPPVQGLVAPLIVRIDDNQTNEQTPIPSASTTAQSATDDDISPPTPGVDDTPYIRFAIDQLTRDEELTGRGRGGSGESEESYPVERIIPDEGLGYYKQGKQLPLRGDQAAGRSAEKSASLGEGFLVPVEVPEEDLRYPQLNFLPGVLRPLQMIMFIICCVSMIGALIFCNIWSTQHNGLWNYDGVGSGRYFVFQFLPQILASIIILWLFVVEAAVRRLLPFTALASARRSECLGVMYNMSLFRSRFLLPDLSFLGLRQPLVGICLFIFWMSTFTIPLQASAFQTRLVNLDGQDTWRWTAVRPVVWTLVALYALLVTALLAILVRFSKKQTGLIWDATSLADLLVLIRRSNILHQFDGSETSADLGLNKPSLNHRLGYWRMSNKPQDIFYAIGQENEPMRKYSLRQGFQVGKPLKPTFQDPVSFDVEGQRPLKSTTLESLQTDIHSPKVRYRWTPWFLRDTFVAAWIATAMVLLVAFIVVSFVRRAVRNGFPPLLTSSTNPLGFSPADFLYSFLPSLLGLVLFLLWHSIDMYFRKLQPFSNLASPRGTSAEESLLLDYTSSLPVAVTIKAGAAGHYKVAWFSFISLLSVTLPVLGGGIFTAQFFAAEQEVREAACMPAFYALVVFVIIYATSFLFIWPGRRRCLPHDVRTLADLISFVYQSQILDDAAFSTPMSKTDLVTRLLSPPPGEKTKPKYAFGVFMGRDGKEHLGIDRLYRPGSGEMLITTGTMR